MNAQTQIANAPQAHSVGLLNLETFEFSQRVARMLSSSTLVPEQYRAVLKVKAGKDQNGNWMYRDEENPNGLSNCIIALNMANRMGADPLMIMQNLYLIEGRPSWSSQFIMASINSCGRFSALRFEMEDLGEKEVEYQETAWVSGRKQTSTKKMKIQNLACTAWVIERESGERLNSAKITIEMAVKEGWYQKNGSKWQTMPEQMLRYRAASFFGRVYAPELLMGLRSAEEEQDRIIDITPDQEIVVKADVSQLKRAILAVKSPAELDQLEEQVFDVADDAQRKELTKIVQAQAKKFQPAQTIDEQPVIEKKPTSADVKKQYILRMNEAQSVAELNEIHEEFIINDVLTGPHLAYLKDAYMQDKKKFKASEQPVEQEGAQTKMPQSAELKEEYAKALNTAKSLADVLDIEEQIENDSSLNQADAQYLTANIEQVRAKFEKGSTPAAPQINEIKSKNLMSGLMTLIGGADSVDKLVELAPQIGGSKDKLLPEHHQELLQAYQQRKVILEGQADMFQ